VKGMYKGSGTGTLTASGVYGPHRVEITLEILSMTPQTPNRDPAQSSPADPSIYDVTARLMAQVTGYGFTDDQVTGTYKLTHFPDVFSAQTGHLDVGLSSAPSDPLNASILSGDFQTGQITVTDAVFGKSPNGNIW